MPKRLILDVIADDFNPDTDICIGPWCFQDAEHIYPEWDRVDFLNPFSSPGDLTYASTQALALYENRVQDLAEHYNQKHALALSDFAWRHILIGWYLHLIQVSYIRFEHIRLFVEKYKEDTIEVRLAPENTDWVLPVSHSLSHLSSRRDFDYWLSSVLLRKIAPPHWTLIDDENFKAEPPPEIETHTVQHNDNPALKCKIREAVLKWIEKGRFEHIHGTCWRSQIFLNAFLSFLPARPHKTGTEARKVLKEQIDLSFFQEEYIECLDFLAGKTEPECFKSVSVFAENLKTAQKKTYKKNKIRIALPDVFNEVKKLEHALAHEAGEKIIMSQHGSWYGTVSCIDFSHATEYAQYAFFSWGWSDHSLKGRYKALPSPMPTRFKANRRKAARSEDLLFVDNLVNLRSARMAGQPMPTDTLRRRYEKKIFLETLHDGPYKQTLYRPHIHHTGIDERGFIKKYFNDIRILDSNSMDEALLGCKLYVSNHYGTTLHLALAANIPTICYWTDFPPMTEKADRIFNLLREQNIFFNTAKEAANHINSVWDNLDDWWNAPKTQSAREIWCHENARTNGFWIWEWMKVISRL